MSDAFSSKTTEIPANDNRRATAQPTTPPPMIAVSATPSKEDLLLSTFTVDLVLRELDMTEF
jgi:hypothetical protein